MPIKLEILADNAGELQMHLEALLTMSHKATAAAEPAAGLAGIIDEFVPPPKATPAKKKRTVAKKPASSKVTPLPAEDEDPLGAVNGATEDEDEEEDEEEPSLASDDDLIAQATDKLRDLFKSGAKGIAGVRKLREKYQVTYFHEVSKDRASELWADAVKLEAEIAA
jgi:hypothetical protein